jgi:thiol:disulfide interchange protein DsbD
VASARAEGRPVFVDFTAAWCVTCKVNESLVLKTRKTEKLFARTNTEFLIADWTNKDDVIAAELKRFGRAGVPLYLAYKPGAKEPEVLPQVLTHDILKNALE